MADDLVFGTSLYSRIALRPHATDRPCVTSEKMLDNVAVKVAELGPPDPGFLRDREVQGQLS